MANWPDLRDSNTFTLTAPFGALRFRHGSPSEESVCGGVRCGTFGHGRYGAFAAEGEFDHHGAEEDTGWELLLGSGCWGQSLTCQLGVAVANRGEIRKSPVLLYTIIHVVANWSLYSHPSMSTCCFSGYRI